MRDLKIFLSIVFLGVFLTLVFVALMKYKSRIEKCQIEPAQALPSPTQTPEPITKVSYSCNLGKTVLQELEQNAKEIASEESKLGKVITGINNQKVAGKNWSFTIDGKESTL